MQPISKNYQHHSLITGKPFIGQPTLKGRELSSKLSRFIGTTEDIVQICSLICRHATSYGHVQEGHCNGHPACISGRLPIETVHRLQSDFEEWLAKRDDQLEKRIADLVEQLPHTDDGPLRVHFQGDPRGSTVRLILPDRDPEQDYGIPVPGA